jgi:3-hydroxyacyl-CoA dehydrogenase
MDYGDRYLGKQTVLCKDTPAFIANRIGFYTGNKVYDLTMKYDLNIVEVDKLTGPVIGWPNTGSFRLGDLVGLDTMVKVTNGVIDNCPNDDYAQHVKERGIPSFLQYLLDNKFLGNKSGQGFYKKTNKRDENGRSIIHGLNLHTHAYEATQKPNLPALGIAKKVSKMDKRLHELMASDDKGGQFVKDLILGLIAYVSNRIPEISDNIFSIDDAMKAGYAWEYGPFEYWDMLGLEAGIKMAEENGETIADWAKEMLKNGHTSFYKVENGKKLFYDLSSGAYQVVPSVSEFIILDNLRGKKPVYQNSECTVHDIGDGVMCLEFTSKANAIGDGIGQGMEEAIRISEEEGWNGIVIGNNAKNFTVGANLMAVGMYAMQKDFTTLEKMVDGFQQINMHVRYCNVPVVVATQGYVFGGGCEILMHCDAAVCAAESYIGLVEVGVGLIPGGGGTKEFALRASESYFEGDVKIPTLVEKLKAIATASVSTSAYEGFNYGSLLPERDRVVINTSRNLLEAKKEVLRLSERYTPPIPKEVHVLGRSGLATLYTAINEFYLGKYMSEYDVEIARKVAFVLCGGDLTSEQKVSEQYLLDIEREAFLALLGNQKTLDRIQYMLMNNKPLRN